MSRWSRQHILNVPMLVWKIRTAWTSSWTESWESTSTCRTLSFNISRTHTSMSFWKRNGRSIGTWVFSVRTSSLCVLFWKKSNLIFLNSTGFNFTPTISRDSHQNIRLHIGARVNVVLLTYLLTLWLKLPMTGWLLGWLDGNLLVG